MAARLAAPLGSLFARIRRRFSPLTRGLCLFAVINIVAINLCLFFSNTPAMLRWTSLPSTLNFLRGEKLEGFGDSWEPMRAAYDQLRRNPAQSLYEELFFKQQTKFQYPPTALLVIAGVQRVAGQAHLGRVLDGLSWLAILILLAFSVRLFEQSLANIEPTAAATGNERLIRLATLIALALTFYPALRAYNLGQIQTWLNALVAVQLWAWFTGRSRLAGILAGAACLIKPQQSLLFVWALLRRRWAFLWMGLSVLAVGAAVSIVLFGWANHVEYLRVLSFISRHGESYFPNHSVNGLLNRLFRNGNNLEWDAHHFAPFHPWVYAGTLLSSLVFVVLALRSRRRQNHGADTADFALMLLAATMASPVAWEHHYGILVPIFAFLTPPALKYQPLGRWTMLSLAASFVLCSQYMTIVKRLADAPYGLNILQSYLFFGALAVFVMLYRLRKA